MSNALQIFLASGALLGFIGVGAGAFGAHFLKSKFFPGDLEIYETAVRYQMYHVFALLAVALLAGSHPSGWFMMAGMTFLAGILLFSGSLYALVFSGIRAWGAVTPFGGVLLLIGWLSLFLGGFFAIRH